MPFTCKMQLLLPGRQELLILLRCSLSGKSPTAEGCIFPWHQWSWGGNFMGWKAQFSFELMALNKTNAKLVLTKTPTFP